MDITVLDGIIIGSVGGALAGIAVWVVNLLREKITEREHKNRIYKWLDNETKSFSNLTVGMPNDPRWRSTFDISSYNNLPLDRVRYICSIHEKIVMKIEKDIWPIEPWKEMCGIKDFTINK